MVTPAATRWPPKQVAALREAAVQVERRDRAAGTLPLVAVEGDEHARPAELFDDARCHDPDHARVPSLFGEHDAERRREIQLLHERPRSVERAAVDLLPPRVQLLELSRDGIRLLLARRQQQLHTAERAAEPARGI
jgi:hypothetical protein